MVSNNKENRVHRDWTKGNTFHNLLSLSWPIIISRTFNIIGPVIDMVWVAKLGAPAIAGVGVAAMAVRVVTSARMGLAVGTRAIVARHIGASDTTGANHVAQQAFIISSVFAITVASIGVLFTDGIMGLFGLEADVIVEGSAYMRIYFLCSVAISFRLMSEGLMHASGDTITPMRISIFFRVIHAIISPLLIFGLLFFPRLGVSGAALANVISQSVGGIIGFWILFSGRSRLKLTLRNFQVDFGVIWRIVKIGIPAAFMSMERSFGDLVLMWFMSPFGTLAVAGHALVQRIESIIRMPCMGLGYGSGILVGQNLGAGQPERAERSGWLAAIISQGFAVLIFLVTILFAENIIGLFNSEPDIVELSSVYLRIAAAGYLFMGLYFVMQNAISGSGDTIPTMLVTLLNFWLVQVSLAFFLSRYTDMGMYGVRWAMVVGWVVGAAAYSIYFRSGRWKRKVV
ncbi:MATE family efflux transporter [Chloroflexota bacterium]